MRTTERRPLGVTVLAILAIIGGVLSLLGGILLITGGAAVGAGAVATTATVTAGMAAFIVIEGVVSVILALLAIAFGVGALRADAWAWMLGIIVAVLNIVSGVASIILDTSRYNLTYAIEQNVIGLAIAIIILAYLNTARVRAYFGRRTTASAM